jgi:hypothetical protein
MVSVIRNSFAWLLALALLTGCSGEKDPDREKKDTAKDSVEKDSGKRNVKPDFSLTSSQFDAEFKKGGAGPEKYKSKIVELTGPVTGAGNAPVNSEGGEKLRPSLTLQGEEVTDLIGCVTVDPQPWTKAAPGQTVKLRGECRGNAQLLDCEILEVTGQAPPIMSAEELVKETARDLDAAKKKYGGKYLQLSGEILQVTSAKGGGARVWFKASVTKPRLFVVLGKDQKPLIDTLKAGQQFKFLGQFSIGRASEEPIQMLNGLPLK